MTCSCAAVQKITGPTGSESFSGLKPMDTASAIICEISYQANLLSSVSLVPLFTANELCFWSQKTSSEGEYVKMFYSSIVVQKADLRYSSVCDKTTTIDQLKYEFEF